MAVIIKNLEIEPVFADVLRYMGVPARGPVDPAVETVCRAAMLEAGSLVTAAGMFEVFGISEAAADSVLLDGGERLGGIGVAALLRGCEKAAVLAATAGPAVLEAAGREMQAGRLAAGLALDAAGSDAAEKAADAVEAELGRAAAGDGFKLTRRYSPGYCDFDLREQAKIFRLIKPEEIGVRLTESFYLVPVKSVTAVAGLYRGKRRGGIMPPCGACARRECAYRRRPQKM